MKIKFKKSLMLTALSTFVVGATIAPLAVTACGNGNSTLAKPDIPSTPEGTDKPAQPDQPNPSEPGADVSLITSGLNKGLPVDYDQAQLEKAVSDYAESIKMKTDAELMQSLNDLMKQLNDANTTAYEGIKDLATWTPLKENPTDPEHPSGGWTLNGNKNLNDIYIFFCW